MARILVVEDDPLLREIVSSMLRLEGHVVETASDGEAGLETARGGGFDLVLMDLVLPKMGGVEVIGILKQESPDLPVIAMSGSANDGPDAPLRRALKAGAVEAVEKTFGPQHLGEVVHRWVDRPKPA